MSSRSMLFDLFNSFFGLFLDAVSEGFRFSFMWFKFFVLGLLLATFMRKVQIFHKIILFMSNYFSFCLKKMNFLPFLNEFRFEPSSVLQWTAALSISFAVTMEPVSIWIRDATAKPIVEEARMKDIVVSTFSILFLFEIIINLFLEWDKSFETK